MSEYHVGFTGTRLGMTPQQHAAVAEILDNMMTNRGPCVLHHGDCIGADEQAHDIATDAGLGVHIHPPIDSSKRAHCVGTHWDPAPPKGYMARNADIVRASRCLIACPDGPERLRSGTWATARMARRERRHIVIIYPDGKRNIESW